MTHRIIRLVALYILCFHFATTHAQQVNINLFAPYSTYLQDYVQSVPNKITATIFYNDADVSIRYLPVRIKVRIYSADRSREISTKETYRPAVPFELENGKLNQLQGFDLAPYFNTAHLDFIGQYTQTANGIQLPEGFYYFCIEVWEENRPVKIADGCSAITYIRQDNPPLLTQINSLAGPPFFYTQATEVGKIEATDPQQVTFYWDANNSGSLNIIQGIEYELQIVEIFPDERDPNEAFRTGFIYRFPSTFQKYLTVGFADYTFIPGKSYAVRLKVSDNSGLELFKNNGLSPAYKFRYGDPCIVPYGFDAKTANYSQSRISWGSNPTNTAYKLYYRQQGQTDWYSQSNLYLTNYQINNLTPGKSYQYKVQASCGSLFSPESDISTFKVEDKPDDAFVCGSAGAVTPISVPQGAPKEYITAEDEVYVSKYKIKITEATGSNGRFTGKGYITIPFLNNAKLQVTFKDVFINTDNKVTRGLIAVNGAQVNAVPEVIKEKAILIVDKLDEITNEAEKLVESTQTTLNDANNILQEYKNLPADVVEKIKHGKELLNEGKNLVAAGNSKDGENLIEQGKKELKEAVKKAVDAVKSGNVSQVVSTISSGGDKLRELVIAELNSKQSISGQSLESINVLIPNESVAFNNANQSIENERKTVVIDDEQDDEASDMEVVAWEMEEDNRELAAEEKTALAQSGSRGLALTSMNNLIVLLQDAAKLRYTLILLNQWKDKDGFEKFLAELKTDAISLGKQLLLNVIQNSNTTDTEKFVKEYVENKINEKLR